MLPLVYSVIAAGTGVSALVGTRIYRHGTAPQDVTAPYVTWSAPGGFAENAFDGASADVWRVNVDCWSDGDAQIETLAEAVRTAMEPYAHLSSYYADERDFETRRYRIGMSFDWIGPR
jgi:hypothetical protein